MQSHSSIDPELYGRIKESVSMREIAEHYGYKVNGQGLCICPFHRDKRPSLRIYPNGKGFYCFACGTGGDQIKFVAMLNKVSNYEAAKEIAAAFAIPIMEPQSYAEKREAARKRKHRAEITDFKAKAGKCLSEYRNRLCERITARRDGFMEALGELTYIEYLMEQVDQNTEAVMADRKAVSRIGEIERRIAGGSEEASRDCAVSG